MQPTSNPSNPTQSNTTPNPFSGSGACPSGESVAAQPPRPLHVTATTVVIFVPQPPPAPTPAAAQPTPFTHHVMKMLAGITDATNTYAQLWAQLVPAVKGDSAGRFIRGIHARVAKALGEKTPQLILHALQPIVDELVQEIQQAEIIHREMHQDDPERERGAYRLRRAQ